VLTRANSHLYDLICPLRKKNKVTNPAGLGIKNRLLARAIRNSPEVEEDAS
jgi:hypothetical protein